MKDHRAVFELSHRAGRRRPFAAQPDGGEAPREVIIEALAKLSRATSCFPAAFAPVEVTLPPPGSPPSADGLLQQWGNLGKAAWFLDGGVLDNKPFTYTIRAISLRNADRAVERRLFYVEPDPEILKAATRQEAPNFLQTVLAALIGIPGYESIADDLKLLAARNSKLAQYDRLLLRDFSRAASKPTPEGWNLYVKCRLVGLSERVLRGLFRVQGRDSLIAGDQRARAAELIRSFDNLGSGDEAEAIFEAFDIYHRHRRASRLIYLLHDLLYTARGYALSPVQKEHFHQLLRALNAFIDLYDIIQSAMERLIDEAPIPWQEKEAREDWHSVSAALQRLLPNDDAAGETLRTFRHALAQRTPWLSPEILTAFSARLRTLTGTVVEEFKAGRFVRPEAGRATLLSTLDQFERITVKACTQPGDPVRLAWENFPYDDAILFPLEMVGDLREKDIIETVRISPRDAQRGLSEKGFNDMVAGDAMYHFGGFFKRSWRSNDILWGRLDGACQLLETLLDRQRVHQLATDPAGRARLADALFAPADAGQPPTLDPARLFPRAGALTHATLRAWLTDLALGDAGAALAAVRFEETVTLLIEASQLEILDTDFRTVLTDAISEQAEWNSFQVAPPLTAAQQTERTQAVNAFLTDRPRLTPDEQAERRRQLAASPFIFRQAKGTLDPFFASVAAVERADQVMQTFAEGTEPAGGPALRPMETRLGRYFLAEYSVGAEELTRDLPASILLELLAHTLLVTRSCVLRLFEPAHRARIRSHPLYIFGLDLPLRAFHAAIVFSRRAPDLAKVIFPALAAAALVALVIGVVWFGTLINPPVPASGHTFQQMPFILLIVLPAITLFILCIIGALALRNWMRRR